MSSWTQQSEEPAQEQDYSPVWQDKDGAWVYRVSAIYGCTSLLLAYRLGVSATNATPEWLQERFDEGHAYENTILERARQRGFSNIYNFQDRTVQNIGTGARLVGHIDAMGVGAFIPDTIDGVENTGMRAWKPKGAVIIDAKAFAQSTWDNWRRGQFSAFPYYGWSMSAYTKNYGDIPIVMAIGLKDREAYEQTGECVLKDFRLDLFTKPPVPFGKIMAKILKVENLAKQGMAGLPEGCDNPTFPCPFFSMPFHTKGGKGLEIVDGQITGGLEKLAELANARHEAYEAGKRAQVLVEEIDGQMKELVGDNEGNANIAAHSDTVSSVSFYHAGYPKIRWDEMVKAHPGLDPGKYKETAKSEKLSVKLNVKRTSPKPNVAALTD